MLCYVIIFWEADSQNIKFQVVTSPTYLPQKSEAREIPMISKRGDPRPDLSHY